jgi:hypothetical protein
MLARVLELRARVLELRVGVLELPNERNAHLAGTCCCYEGREHSLKMQPSINFMICVFASWQQGVQLATARNPCYRAVNTQDTWGGPGSHFLRVVVLRVPGFFLEGAQPPL